MRPSLSQTINSTLCRELRECVSPLFFQVKDRKIRIVILRCLRSNPEYETRLKEKERLAKREGKLLGYGRAQLNYFITERKYSELVQIYKDMESAFVHLESLLKFYKHKTIYPSLGALRTHVFKNTALYL